MGNQQWKTLQFPVSYTLGLYLGDGCLSDYNVRIVGIDFDILDYAKTEIESIFPKTCYMSIVEEKYYKLNIASKVSKFFRPYKKKYIPEFVFDWSVSNKKEFIAGLLDADGYISLRKNVKYNNTYAQMGFVSTNLVGDFSRLLNSVGCKTGKITEKSNHKINKNWKKCFQLYIPIKSFVEADLYFRCCRKQERLVYYKENFCCM